MNAILAAQQRIRDLETDPLSGSDSDGGGGLGFGAETAVTSQDVAKYRRGSGNGEPLMVTPEARMEAFNRFQHMLRQHPAIQQAIEEEHRMLVTRFLFVEELVQVRIPAPPSAFCNDPMLLMHSCVCVCVCVSTCVGCRKMFSRCTHKATHQETPWVARLTMAWMRLATHKAAPSASL